MYYIIHSIYTNEGLNQIRGAHTLKSMLSFGVVVIFIFSAIFLFYTNSFLIKKRKKEIGLYNILGMGKKHIAKMIVFEVLFISALTLCLGIISGIILSKLIFLILLKLLRFAVPLQFSISFNSIIITFILFIVIFSLTLLFNLTQIHISNPIELLKGDQIGEKEPKTKWILVVISIITLGIGYSIAIFVDKPTDAIGTFFIAVVLVIIGTYSLFTAVTIAFLKLLKKNKNFYYKTKHFVAISGMIYRLKQNAVGLANICILSTAVLVILSATISLYLGQESILRTRYPNDISIVSPSINDYNSNNIAKIVETGLKNYNLEPKDLIKYNSVTFMTSRDKTTFYLEDKTNIYCEIHLINLNEYNELENESISLNDDEILLYSIGKDYGEDTFNILDKQFKVKQELKEFKVDNKFSYVGLDSYYIILNDVNLITDSIYKIYNSDSTTISLIRENYYHNFNLDTDEAAKLNFVNSIKNEINKDGISRIKVYSPYTEREEFFTMYGGLFFIGIAFGSLFLMATVLIIYYKQISEGFDDKNRFEIMQKVGMSKREVKSSIKNQIVIVFFLPLTMAIIHMIVAFGVIEKLMVLFGFIDTPLFILCSIGTVLSFALVYFIVYILTARAYYKIVN